MAAATESRRGPSPHYPRTPGASGTETTDDRSSPSRIVPVSTPNQSQSQSQSQSRPPIIQTSAPSPGDPMEITSPSNPGASSPLAPSHDGNPNSNSNSNSDPQTNTNGAADRDRPKNSSPPSQPSANTNSMLAPSASNANAPTAAAPAVHQPKIVQTAFIHKLYNMLEDQSIQHLISWSPTNESFVMSPSPDFSKVLAQYFKHTNISSFVRQLNMYGFHKVSDAFHTGNPELAMWEFKHGNGNFKRGDLVGLREIKRRASRHALVHREFPNHKTSTPQPSTPAEPMPPPAVDGADPRMVGMDHSLYDMSVRLQRSEESLHYMHIRHQAVMETMGRLLHFNQELSKSLLNLVPSTDNPVHRDVANLQSEMQRQAEMFRSLEEPHEPFFSGGRSYLSHVENASVSPHQLAQDDPRRSNLGVPSARGQGTFHRPAVPSGLSNPNLSVSTRRPYGSIGGGTTPQSPSPLRGQAQPPAPGPHPLAQVEHAPNNLARRHTSADIRAPGWQGNPSYGGSGPPSGPWPSSPGRGPAPEDQRIRDSLSTYSFQTASQRHEGSRPTTPPPPSHFPNGSGGSGGGGGPDSFASWSWNTASRGSLAAKDSSIPPTRRGSMAHILNPTDTAEREEEDEDPRGDDDRKRKRRQ